MLSNVHQTNAVPVRIDFEDEIYFSRIELLRRLLVVLFESVEEDCPTSDR